MYINTHTGENNPSKPRKAIASQPFLNHPFQPPASPNILPNLSQSTHTQNVNSHPHQHEPTTSTAGPLGIRPALHALRARTIPAQGGPSPPIPDHQHAMARGRPGPPGSGGPGGGSRGRCRPATSRSCRRLARVFLPRGTDPGIEAGARQRHANIRSEAGFGRQRRRRWGIRRESGGGSRGRVRVEEAVRA